MDLTLITGLLSTLLALIPQLTTSKQVNGIVAYLVQLVPVIVKSYQDLLPMVQNVIALLKQSGAVTPAQMAALKALDAQVDKAFDDAWAVYQVAHPAPAAAQTASPAKPASVPSSSSAVSNAGGTAGIS